MCSIRPSEYLSIIANGGNGGQGQSGGNGQNGADGNDGEDGKLTTGFLSAIKNYLNWYKIKRGTEGKAGGRGGNGGRAGLGGGKGVRGSITVHCPNSGRDILKETKDGVDGKDGSNGKGANGGTGGRQGVDDGVAHQGSWCPGFDGRTWGKGKLGKKEYRRWYGFAGYELVFLKTEAEVRSSRAIHGNRGQDGEKAGERSHCRQNSSKKSAIDEMEATAKFVEAVSSRNTGSLDAELEAMRREATQVQSDHAKETSKTENTRNELEKLRQDQNQLSREKEGAQTILLMKHESCEQEKATLELEEAVLAKIHIEKDKTMEVVQQAQAAMKQESLQVIQQQTRQVTVLRHVDPSSFGATTSKRQQPAAGGPSYEKPTPIGQVRDSPGQIVNGMLGDEIQLIVTNEPLMTALRQLSTAGEGYRAAISSKFKEMIGRKDNAGLQEILETLEKGKDYKSQDLVQLCRMALKIESTYPAFPKLTSVIHKMVNEQVEIWFRRKILDLNQDVDPELLLQAAHQAYKVLGNISPLGAIECLEFASVCSVLLEVLTHKSYKGKEMEEIGQQVLLRLTGIQAKKSDLTSVQAIIQV